MNDRCGFTPSTPGYLPCTRLKGHSGPCAHHLDPLAFEQSLNELCMLSSDQLDGPLGRVAAKAQKVRFIKHE